MENGMRKYHKVSSYEADPAEVKRAVLLYSGGLDSSIMIKWLQEEYQCEVVTLTINLGQLNDDLESIRRKALKIGAFEAVIVDAVDDFVDEYIFKGIKANARYQGNYHLSTPLGRPLMAKHAVRVATEIGADAIAHGCTGKGNDQVRLDAGILTLCPGMKVIAPVREWNLGREEEMAYASRHGIEVPVTDASPYSHDDNLWGVTSEGGEIENPESAAPVASALCITTHPIAAPDQPEDVTIGFEQGVPVSLNGAKMKGSDLIRKLNGIAAAHGVGICTLIEDRLIGTKVRGVYEGPAAAVLIEAHKDLEKLVSTRTENEMKEIVDVKWAYMCYGAQWFEPLMASLNAFIDKFNEKVTGEVCAQLYKGNVNVLSVRSENSLLELGAATFSGGGDFNTNCSAPFIQFYSQAAVRAYQVRNRNGVTV
jgi:argininosuccinate synthase